MVLALLILMVVVVDIVVGGGVDVVPKPLCVWVSFSHTPEHEKDNAGKREFLPTRQTLMLSPQLLMNEEL